MKIEMELEDYELNGEDWENELKDYLKKAYFDALKEKIDAKISEEIKKSIKEKMIITIENEITRLINDRFDKKDTYFRHTQYTNTIQGNMEEFLETFMGNFTSSQAQNLIKNRCEKVIENLTRRYDDAYGEEIIQRLFDKQYLSDNLQNLLSKEEK